MSRCRAPRRSSLTVFGPRPGISQHLDEARRDLLAELVVEPHPAGRDELGDLVADRLADTRHLRRRAGAVGCDEVDRTAPDRVGRPVVGNGFEDEFALDLEHVADLVEDPGQAAVGQLALGGCIVVVSDVCVVDVGVPVVVGLVVDRRFVVRFAFLRHPADATRPRLDILHAPPTVALGDEIGQVQCRSTPIPARAERQCGRNASGWRLMPPGCVWRNRQPRVRAAWSARPRRPGRDLGASHRRGRDRPVR